MLGVLNKTASARKAFLKELITVLVQIKKQQCAVPYQPSSIGFRFRKIGKKILLFLIAKKL